MSSSSSSTQTLIVALRILSEDIESQDGVTNAAIAEAAERMNTMSGLLNRAADIIEYRCTAEHQAKWLADAKAIGVIPCPF